MDKSRQLKIAFLTQNCFSQCDVAVLPKLIEHHDVRWWVFYPRDDVFSYSPQELSDVCRAANIQLRIEKLRSRLRSPKVMSSYLRILKDIISWKPDVLYVNATGYPWLAPLVSLLARGTRVVWAIHDAEEHAQGFKAKLFGCYTNYTMRVFRSFHVLSKNQKTIVERRVNSAARVFYAPHPLLGYGEAKDQRSDDIVTFLFFGNIVEYKGVDLLIRAAQIVRERGILNFKVCIAGNSRDWHGYKSLVRFPDIFDFDIRFIPSERIPELFGMAHWLVLPYRHLTQSGPMSMALNYALPTIVSDLQGFQEFVVDGVTSIPFECDNVDSLAEALMQAIHEGAAGWRVFHQAQIDYVERNYSNTTCAAMYSAMFCRVMEDDFVISA